VSTKGYTPLTSEPVSAHPLDTTSLNGHYLIGGTPGQDKSNLTRMLARGVFDPAAEIGAPIWAPLVGEPSDVNAFTPTQGEGVVCP
jgi:hypothetical protein